MNIQESREFLNEWWNSLTEEEKKKVAIFRNKVDLNVLFGIDSKRLKLRKKLQEDIIKIEEELRSFGVLKNDDNEVIKALMCDFITNCKSNPELLWDIELTSKVGIQRWWKNKEVDDYFEQFGFISLSYLAKKFNCRTSQLKTPMMLDLIKALNQLLLKHEVSLPYTEIKDTSDSVGSDLNHRRIFLKWEKSLTDEKKLSLPMFGRVIDKLALKDLFPIERLQTLRPLLKAEFKRFSNEILELQRPDYRTIKERANIRAEKALSKKESPRSEFRKLRNKKLVSVEDFNTNKGHYEHVRHAFAVASLGAPSKSGNSNYYMGYTYYCDFLKVKDISPDSCFRECFNSWSLREFRDYLGDKISEGHLSTGFSSTILSTLRMTLERLKTIRNFEFNYLPADGFEAVRNTLAYKHYTPYERKQINEMLEQEMALVKKKLEPYEYLDRDSADLDDPKIKARIIFEDDCNCIPPYWDAEDGSWAQTKGQRKLRTFLTTRRLSLPELLKEWRLLYHKVEVSEVGVYVLKMAQVLGMNLEPILDLEIDDYQAHHPLTNKPCLTYWKERSTGEKMIHLDLFHAELQWLTVSQKKFVETVFDDVIQLTSEARKYLPKDLSKRLFVSNDKIPKCIQGLDMSRLYSELVDKYQLKDDDGEPLMLRVTRFRPTLVSELIDAGVSIREIQYLLGHTSLYTTMKYLEQLEFDRVIKEKARKAIENIYSSTVYINKHKYRYDDSLIIMKTPLGGCKNIFDPPDFIKNSSLYVKGRPCSQYNKCLSCENVMLTEHHLPELFAMQRDYLASLESGAVVNTPYHAVVIENLSLLEDILNPETSEFEEDILIQAKEDSLFIETTILDSWGG